MVDAFQNRINETLEGYLAKRVILPAEGTIFDDVTRTAAGDYDHYLSFKFAETSFQDVQTLDESASLTDTYRSNLQAYLAGLTVFERNPRLQFVTLDQSGSFAIRWGPGSSRIRG